MTTTPGTHLLTAACLIALWYDSNLPWWLFVIFLVTGWWINLIAAYVELANRKK